jgi:hypothetical protein
MRYAPIGLLTGVALLFAQHPFVRAAVIEADICIFGGTSTGVIAAVQSPVQQGDYAKLRARLLMDGQILAWQARPATSSDTSKIAAKSDAAKQSPLADPDFFPILVWLQSPANAQKYKAIGINTYIGLWKGPTEEQLARLEKAGMYVICEQNEVGLKNTNKPLIIAWMHGDEPDNAQDMKEVWRSDLEAIRKAWPEAPANAFKTDSQYGPPIPPGKIIADWGQIKKADPTRPVVLNLGQGVAWEGYYGRGYRSGKLEDYPEYIKGCDIVSFDIYPVNHDQKAIEGKLEFVAQGVDRLVQWSDGKKPVWNCIECTPMGGLERNPTPSQVRSEVWMSIIHGSKGIIYFAHIFKPKFIEAGLLANQEMAGAVGAINQQIAELAPVINSPNTDAASVIRTTGDKVPIDIMVKRKEGATYVFAIDMRNVDTQATFQVKGLTGKAVVEVLGENRKLEANDGCFTDDFKGYAVHIYKIMK